MDIVRFYLLHCLVTAHLYCLSSSQVCTDRNNIRDLVLNTRVIADHYYGAFTTGPLTCARQCMLRRRCQSFNYNNGHCILFHFNSQSRKYTSELNASYVFSDILKWPQKLIGPCANHNCAVDSRCDILPNNTSHCVKVHPSSCAEVKKCNGVSVDGEYWIYLSEFQYQRVRVYCHGMNTLKPGEYITLINPNTGNYPNLRNPDCKGSSALSAEEQFKTGTTTYTKININLNLSVNITDRTFATGTALRGELYDYGTAQDCYTNHDIIESDCGVQGSFTVDLRKTGFKVEQTQKWKANGWMPFASVKWVTSSFVELKCGGYCGDCAPIGHLQLSVNPDDVLDNASATTVDCN